MRWGVEQSRNLMTVRAASQTGMAKITANARKLGVGDYPNYLSISLGAGDTTVAKLVNAYAILANQGRAVKPTHDRLCPGSHRQGHLPHGQPLPGDGQLQLPRSGTGRACLDRHRATASCSIRWRRSRWSTSWKASSNAAPRPSCAISIDRCSARPERRRGPTNVWFVGGTPEVVGGVYLGYDQPRSMGGYAQGGRIAAPIFKQFAQAAFKGMPKLPFVAPNGIRWVRVDRATGRRVFGSFPVQEDPKSAVIWEAFQPQTEPRRFRRSHSLEVPGQAGEEGEDDPSSVAALERRPRVIRARQPERTQPRAADATLQNQAAIF